ncbi:MAG: diadenylate cyclase CdaA [Chloroflexi bacterium]|nr:diadenylate cyclase CdaA [Chloroflexota bacterium]MCY3938300.1 diadenylate cyclase CdaA [Chloroflexota bacterium]
MSEQLGYLASQFNFLAFLQILFVAVLFHAVLTLIRNTQADIVLRGAVVLFVLVIVVGRAFDLTLINWLLENALPSIILVVAVIFAPELRRLLERVGRTGGMFANPFSSAEDTATRDMVAAVSGAAGALSRRSWGGLMVLERSGGLDEFVDTGTRVDAAISEDLLMAIFYPNSELHDGAVIVLGNVILAAGCVLPISEAVEPERHLGTRHRAGLGITDETDAIAVIVSEETGSISLAMNGRLRRDLTADELRRRLQAIFRHGIRGPSIQGLPAWLTRR